MPAGLIAAGLLAALAVAGCSAAAAGAAPGRAAPGSVSGCTAFAYRAIRAREVVSDLPAACQGISRAQVNYAVSLAIRQASAGPKSVWRRQAGAAAPWVSALLTGPVQVPAAVTVGTPSGPGGSRLGGVSELAVQVAALLAWLATAVSGGYVLLRWLRAGGRLRGHPGRSGRSGMAAPPGVTAGHAAFGLLGLVLWAGFMITGWTVLAWTTVGLLGLVAGLGMSPLALGLPSPRPGPVPGPGAVPESGPVPRGGTATLIAPAVPAAPAGASRARVPVFVIASHGLFAAVVLLLVITATIGAV